MRLPGPIGKGGILSGGWEDASGSASPKLTRPGNPAATWHLNPLPRNTANVDEAIAPKPRLAIDGGDGCPYDHHAGSHARSVPWEVSDAIAAFFADNTPRPLRKSSRGASGKDQDREVAIRPARLG